VKIDLSERELFIPKLVFRVKNVEGRVMNIAIDSKLNSHSRENKINVIGLELIKSITLLFTTLMVLGLGLSILSQFTQTLLWPIVFSALMLGPILSSANHLFTRGSVSFTA